MEIKSLNECLDIIDQLMYDGGFLPVIRRNLKLIREYIKQSHHDLSDGEYIQGGIAYLNTLAQINMVINISCSSIYDENYEILRNKILDWYDLIITHNDNNDENEDKDEDILFQRN